MGEKRRKGCGGCGGLIGIFIVAGATVLVMSKIEPPGSQPVAPSPVPLPTPEVSSATQQPSSTQASVAQANTTADSTTASSNLSARSEDWTFKGKTYHNVVVGKIYPDRVEITFDGGVGTPSLADLSPELQKRFNYDPTAANKAKEEEQAKEAASDAMVTAQAKAQKEAEFVDQVRKSQVKVEGRIVQIIASDSAVLLDTGDGKLIYVSGVNAGTHVDGDNVAVMAVPNGPTTYTTVLGAQATVESYYTLPKE